MAKGSQISCVNPFWVCPPLSEEAKQLLEAIDFLFLGKEGSRHVREVVYVETFAGMFKAGRDYGQNAAYGVVRGLFQELETAELVYGSQDNYRPTEKLRRRYWPYPQPPRRIESAL